MITLNTKDGYRIRRLRYEMPSIASPLGRVLMPSGMPIGAHEIKAGQIISCNKDAERFKVMAAMLYCSVSTERGGDISIDFLSSFEVIGDTVGHDHA